MLASRWSASTSAEPSLGRPATSYRQFIRERVKTVPSIWPVQMEPRRPFDPLHPTPIEPIPSPLRPSSQYIPRNDESVRILKEILDRLTAIENRLKAVEETLRTRR